MTSAHEFRRRSGLVRGRARAHVAALRRDRLLKRAAAARAAADASPGGEATTAGRGPVGMPAPDAAGGEVAHGAGRMAPAGPIAMAEHAAAGSAADPDLRSGAPGAPGDDGADPQVVRATDQGDLSGGWEVGPGPRPGDTPTAPDPGVAHGGGAASPPEPEPEPESEPEPEPEPEPGPEAPEPAGAAPAPGPISAPVVPAPGSDGPCETRRSDLHELPGAGSGFVWLLEGAGVGSLSELARTDATVLSTRLGRIAELVDLDHWIALARAAEGDVAPSGR